ncbi:MAG: hypothetical protein M3024_04780, partial [Candidatus Dormibacteraeota bacterium]|nr:hypothetical protein [Candidatus Dormibacteraeota bacterium]
AYERAPASEPHPAPGGGGQQGAQASYESVVADMMQMTDDSLGNRSRKVKDLLGSAEPTRRGLEDAIEQIPQISILFVDQARLEGLANELRTKLNSYPA